MAYERTRQKLGLGPDVNDEEVLRRGYAAASAKRPGMSPQEYQTRLQAYEGTGATTAPQASTPPPVAPAPSRAAPVTKFSLPDFVARTAGEAAVPGSPAFGRFLGNMGIEQARDVRAAARTILPMLGRPMGSVVPMPDDAIRTSALALSTAAGYGAGRVLPAALSPVLRGAGMGATSGATDAGVRTGGDPVAMAGGAVLGGGLGGLFGRAQTPALSPAGREAVESYVPRPFRGLVRDTRLAPIPRTAEPNPALNATALDRDYNTFRIGDQSQLPPAQKQLPAPRGGLATTEAAIPEARPLELPAQPETPRLAATAINRPEVEVLGTPKGRKPRPSEPIGEVVEIPEGVRIADDPVTGRKGTTGPGTYGYDPQTEVSPTTRTTAAPHFDVKEFARSAGRFVKGFAQSDPDARGKTFTGGGSVVKALQDTRADIRASKDYAAQYLSDRVWDDLKGRSHTDLQTVLSHMTALDKLAQHKRGMTRLVTGETLEGLEATARLTGEKIKADPSLASATRKTRDMLNAVYNDMVDRGYISRKKFLEDYLPIQRLEQIAEVFAQRGRSGESAGGRVLSSMLRRGRVARLRETGPDVILDALGQYARKVSEDDLVNKVLADPKFNHTEAFLSGKETKIGPDKALYLPGPGMPGHGKLPGVGSLRQGMIRAMMDSGDDSYRGVGYVLDRKVAESLARLHPITPDSDAAFMFWLGNKWASSVTLWNPDNTILNSMSDPFAAVMGLPGEKANPLGVLKFYPRAAKEAFGESMLGLPSELSDAARRTGFEASTYTREVGGREVPRVLRHLYEPESPLHRVGRLSNPLLHLQRARQAVELTPRLASAAAQLERTGSAEEFGRYGRHSTLDYAGSAPLHSRNAFMRLVTPFLQYLKLNTERGYRLATTKGSRARAWSVALGVPAAVAAWNLRNEAYKQAWMSRPARERDQMAVVVPDPNDPEKPMVDAKGLPVVVPVRFMGSEEAMKVIGLGDAPGMAANVASGRIGPGEIPGEVAGRAGKGAARALGPWSGVGQAMNPNTPWGAPRYSGLQPDDALEAAGSFFPQARQAKRVVENVREGRSPVDEVRFGPRPMSVAKQTSRGKSTAIPGDVQDLQFRLRDLRARQTRLRNEGKPNTAAAMQQEIDRVQEKLKRLKGGEISARPARPVRPTRPERKERP